MTIDEHYIKRCISIAKNGLGEVSPNPMVGAVIVYENKIIGEGFHRKFGEAHAEVNAINSVQNKELLTKSTLYVSLEPCSHFGKTPPCTDLIIEMKIPKVIIGNLDPFAKVAGNGIKKLQAANIEVITNILQKECEELNKRFITFHTKKRPYIILKWAESSDKFIDINRPQNTEKPIFFTDEFGRSIVHKWRTEEDAILVGKNTVILDNPQLTSRNYFGHNPKRIIIDKNNYLKNDFQIFNNQAETIIFNSKSEFKNNNLNFVKINFEKDVIEQILNYLYITEIQSIIVEGGSFTLNKFISKNLWDEARIFTSEIKLRNGVKSPDFNFIYKKNLKINNYQLKIYYNDKNNS
ncbi:MAG: bifunctional diaminohydroxyphosphoribosylaminopyrimidine deaminase/5-amino-6-(5-phosphoribosylamino)uracil reductase RibD [Bacteroidales bacterium]|jgi:diaminohydroxyphosphoribosylaminopyrimidine deaminase/5-amino-6-(5-phosphoribosylamino)uracil reductase|nr:bifunctional diaminohydroxyphosphoribosylaminopyrimidine deaminase/5-amino-6-(5-phosphoribosylamino)uracil reductase RibD [Bacteroidales bacterium]